MTIRIRFRELNMEDVVQLYEIYSDKEAMKYRGSKPMETIEDAKVFVRNKEVFKGDTLTIRKAIELAQTKELIGSVMYRSDRNRKNECEIGYSIGREFWGQGFGKEIVEAMLNEIEEKEEIKEVVAWSNRENIASIKILEKTGFQLIEEGINECKYLYQKKMRMKNNIHLQELARLDQLDRTKYDAGELSEEELWVRDRLRLLNVIELYEGKKISTSEDCVNAAIVFQHGRDEKNERSSYASSMAVKMMRKAIDLDESTNKWLLAAAIDRDLMIRNQPQVYGTQYIRKNEGVLWEFYTFDSTKISDEERRWYGVETIAEQEFTLKSMNKKKLLNLYLEIQDIDKALSFCVENISGSTEYDFTWKGISRFGFQLIRLGKEGEALKVFQVLTKLYPHEHDPYHSMGVLLIKIGREEEAIGMFNKSLELNPDFKEAQRDLKKLKEKLG
ncbi:MAG: GNAT family N-acetyltransferase [Chitinophagales bacterium]